VVLGSRREAAWGYSGAYDSQQNRGEAPGHVTSFRGWIQIAKSAAQSGPYGPHAELQAIKKMRISMAVDEHSTDEEIDSVSSIRISAHVGLSAAGGLQRREGRRFCDETNAHLRTRHPAPRSLGQRKPEIIRSHPPRESLSLVGRSWSRWVAGWANPNKTRPTGTSTAWGVGGCSGITCIEILTRQNPYPNEGGMEVMIAVSNRGYPINFPDSLLLH